MLIQSPPSFYLLDTQNNMEQIDSQYIDSTTVRHKKDRMREIKEKSESSTSVQWTF